MKNRPSIWIIPIFVNFITSRKFYLLLLVSQRLNLRLYFRFWAKLPFYLLHVLLDYLSRIYRLLFLLLRLMIEIWFFYSWLKALWWIFYWITACDKWIECCLVLFNGKWITTFFFLFILIIFTELGWTWIWI
jgi:hypothetical protein